MSDFSGNKSKGPMLEGVLLWLVPAVLIFFIVITAVVLYLTGNVTK